MTGYPEEFLQRLHTIQAKRPRTVIQHILQYGFITTQELKDRYGYDHPPRAIRDVREYGIAIETFRVRDTNNKSIAAYRFCEDYSVQSNPTKTSGRTVASKLLKKKLLEEHGARCNIYRENFAPETLQVDHRIPYEIFGEQSHNDATQFMLLSPSANRAKSWACEHCFNQHDKDVAYCSTCFWAYPEKYLHVAGIQEKIVTIRFSGNEVEDYERLLEATGLDGAPGVIKELVRGFVRATLPDGIKR